MVTWAVWRAGLWWDRHRLRRLQFRRDVYGDVTDTQIWGATRQVHNREVSEPWG